MKLPCSSLIALLFLILSLPLFAQNKDFKFGKVEKSELESSVCSIDTSAEAVILCDVGQTYIEYTEAEGFQLFFERYLKIKIFKSEGYSWAELSIPIYTDVTMEEQITVLKGKTYNLENGKVSEIKLGNESVFDEKINRYWKLKKVSMPGVREGSVIEIKYVIKSPFLQRVRDWKFQYSIPALWSEYEIRIPEYFKFSRNATGYIPFVVSELSEVSKTITLVGTSYTGSQMTLQTKYDYTDVKYLEYRQRFAAENVPAMKEEPFTSSVENYQAKIEYDLHSYKYPGGTEKRFTDSWEKILSTLLEDEDFGIQLKRGGLVKSQAARIASATSNPLKQIELAMEEARRTIIWNGAFAKYTHENLNYAITKGSGNSADVNLFLVLLLKEIGLEASPVIISTRDNGFILEDHPEINGFNYVIACATVDGKDILMDATERYGPCDLLPERCLNGKGLVVRLPDFRWVDLSATQANSDLFFAEMKLQENGGMEGTLTVASSGYSGVNVRNRFKKEGESEYSRWLKEQRKVWEVGSIEFADMDSLNKPAKVIYTLSSDEVAEAQGDLIYFDVLLNLGQSSNPFKKENRNYPVDFGAPLKDVYSFTYEIPDGYQVETLPAAKAVMLPEKGGTFRFSASVMGNKILVNSLLDIRQTLFVPSEYDKLREFFALVVEKHGEQIVLKRK